MTREQFIVEHTPVILARLVAALRDENPEDVLTAARDAAGKEWDQSDQYPEIL